MHITRLYHSPLKSQYQIYMQIKQASQVILIWVDHGPNFENSTLNLLFLSLFNSLLLI